MSSIPEPPPQPCPDLTGNPDLYGLGIRVGVYLQWFSTWFAILVDPSSAQDAHDVNSVFVFAIIVATILASRDDVREINSVEAYLMLQFSFGYFFTTMSVIGIRVQMMHPQRLAGLMRGLGDVPGRLRDSVVGFGRRQEEDGEKRSGKVGWVRGLMASLRVYSLSIPMATISFLKPTAMTWSGVLWRTSIVGMVAGFNLWYWFYGVRVLALSENCTRDVFLFGQFGLRGRLVIFYKAVSVAIAVPVFSMVVYLGLISLRLSLFIAICLYRELVFRAADKLNPGSLERFQTTLRRVAPLVEPLTFFNQAGINVFPYLAPEFWATPLNKIPRVSDIIKIFAAIAGGNVKSDMGPSELEPETKVHKLYKRFCIVWNTGVICAMLWFIMSIELTLRWNDVSEVSTIESTGQLIPFIIGVASTAQAIKKAAIITIKKIYPDWAETELRVYQDFFGNTTFEIVKPEPVRTASLPDLPSMTAEGHPLS